MMTYEEWIAVNEEELYIRAAEEGLDREYDWELIQDGWYADLYQKYCEAATDHEWEANLLTQESDRVIYGGGDDIPF